MYRCGKQSINDMSCLSCYVYNICYNRLCFRSGVKNKMSSWLSWLFDTALLIGI